MIKKGKSYLYDVRLGAHHLCCEVLILNPALTDSAFGPESFGIVTKIIKRKDGFQYINVGDKYHFEDSYLKEIYNPNDIMKEIV